MSGLPSVTESVKWSLGYVRRTLEDPDDYSIHSWESEGYIVPFFKKGDRFTWLVYQLTRLYKPSRILIARIYNWLAKHRLVSCVKSESVTENFKKLGFEGNVYIETFSNTSINGDFCLLKNVNVNDLKERSLVEGSSNMLGFANMPRMFEGMKRAVEYITEIYDDDIVIRIRPDLKIISVDLDYYVSLVSHHDIDVVSFCKAGTNRYYGENRLSDQFFIMRLSTFKRVFEALKDMDSIYLRSKALKADGFGGEVIFFCVCNMLDLRFKSVEGIVQIVR